MSKPPLDPLRRRISCRLGTVAPRLRLTAACIFLFRIFGGSSAEAGDQVLFAKELGQGLSVSTYEYFQADPETPNNLGEALNEASRQFFGGEVKPRRPDGFRYRMCSFRVSGDGLPKEGKVVLDIATAFLMPPEIEKGFGVEGLVFYPFLRNDYKVYDVCLAEGSMFVLLHFGRCMQLVQAKVDKHLAKLGQWDFQVLFGYGWQALFNEGVVPIVRAQIIPANDRAYAFIVGKSGGCMLWEVKDKKAKLVWERDTPPGPHDQ